MSDLGSISFTIDADSGDAEKNVEKSFGEMAKSAAKIAGAIYVAKKAFDAITSTFSKATAAAAHADTVVVELAASLRRAGEKDVKSATDSMLRFADSVQQSTGISDEIISQAATLGASFGFTGKRLENATLAAANMAAIMKTDVKSAMSLIVRSASSTTNALTRYGISAGSSSSKSERLATIVENISTKFGGAAAAAVTTYSGRIKVLSQNWGDLYEELGRSITQSDTINGALTVITQSIIGQKDALAEHRGWLESTISTALSGFGAMAQTAIQLKKYVALGFNGIKIAVNLAVAGIVISWEKALGYIQLAFAETAKFVVDRAQDIAAAVALLPGKLGELGRSAQQSLGLLSTSLDDSAESARGLINGVDSLSNVFLSSANDATKAMDREQRAAKRATDQVDAYIARIREAAAAAAAARAAAAEGGGGAAPDEQSDIIPSDSGEKVKEVKKEVDLLKSSLESLAVSGVQTLGTMFGSLIAGAGSWKDAMKQAANSILSTLETLAIKAILANSAVAGSGGAASQAGIPVVGPLLAAGAASAMFALARSFLTKFHDGGIVGGTSREIPIMAERGELVIPTNVTKEIVKGNASIGGGGGGDTYVLNNTIQGMLPAQSGDLARATREQYRMIDKLKRRGWLSAEAGAF